MRAILIDPALRTVEEVSMDEKDTLSQMYQILNVSLVDAVYIYNGDTVWVDDEGLLKGPVYQFFALNKFHSPLTGRGLVTGVDDEGNTIASKSTVETITQHLFWCERLMGALWGVTLARNNTTRVMGYSQMIKYIGG